MQQDTAKGISQAHALLRPRTKIWNTGESTKLMSLRGHKSMVHVFRRTAVTGVSVATVVAQ